MNLILLYIIIASGISFAIGWYINNHIGKNKIVNAEERAKKIIEDAEKESNNIKKEKLLEVKDEWYRKKQEFEQDANAKRNKLQVFEKQLTSREENLDRKVELVNKKEKDIVNHKRL
ncbi:MAG: Rnase Y domain-containing protein, partial [Bacteroidota bacterium]|nr:Rnase Y domain-containing protein [Bacteroidota bacterium]